MFTIESFHVGDRIELVPHHDSWMAGDRYGTVVRIGRQVIHVKMDRSGRVRFTHPESIGKINP